jgi:MoxR-like ATPase/pSer/pThr/pTyr-binding forkhead associated (FHA) protein
VASSREGNVTELRERTITYTASDAESGGEAGPPEPGLIVVFQGSPRDPLGYPINRPRLFGRGDGADVVLVDPGISRAHMTVEPVYDAAASGQAGPLRGPQTGLLVRDLGSRNGTFVDGAQLLKGSRFAPYGSVVRLGKTIFLVHPDVRDYTGTPDPRHPALIGGPSLAGVRRRIDVTRASPVPVLVEGETGSGKEVVARAVHEALGRRGELVEVNCAALPAELVESELFGHARGSFSGSDRARVGLFRSAHEGTLLLDEIGELPQSMQAKLLRVLETGQVRPVGDDRAVQVDVRVVAATNRDLDAMAEAGTFRLDLLHRIAAVRIALPPLRDRLEDVPLLARHFLETEPRPEGAEAPTLSAAALELFLLHRWPGNARELRNAIRAGAAAARASERALIAPEDVSSVLAARAEPPGDEARARILDALAAAGGNVTQAAKDLGIARSGLYETLKRMDVDPASFRPSRPRGR